MTMRTAYLVLAIAGAIIPYAFFIQHFSEAGFGLGDFMQAVFANAAAGGFAANLVISSLVFWVVMIRQRLNRRGPAPLPFILLNLAVGLSCALPAWLYARTPRPVTTQ